MFPSLIILAAIFSTAFNKPVKPISDEPYVVVYSIKDLERTIPNFTDVPAIDLNNALQGTHGGNPFNSPSQTNTSFPEKDAKKIMNLIQDLVEPEAWGDTATMKYWDGNLIIKAPKRIHDQIR